MSNEPVAWIEEDGMVRFDVRWASQMQGKEPIPLYTHPAELTDEKMKEIAMKHQGVWDEDTFLCLDYRSFAREILGKASEK